MQPFIFIIYMPLYKSIILHFATRELNISSHCLSLYFETKKESLAVETDVPCGVFDSRFHWKPSILISLAPQISIINCFFCVCECRSLSPPSPLFADVDLLFSIWSVLWRKSPKAFCTFQEKQLDPWYLFNWLVSFSVFHILCCFLQLASFPLLKNSNTIIATKVMYSL